MGAIRIRGDAYHAQVRIKGWQSFTKTFPTKSLAKRWIEKIEAQLKENPNRSKIKDDVTLADACSRYMNEITPNHKGHASEAARLNFLARGVLGDIDVRYLSTAQVNAYFQSRAKEVKEGSLRKEFILLRRLFSVAISSWNLSIPENPMAHLPVPKDSSNRERRITIDEWDKIITIAPQMRNPLVKAVIRFAYETGMRRSEILRLRWDDIDGNICTIRNTKNGADRVIPVSKKAVQTLTMIEASPEQVFPISGNAIRLSWERILRKAEISDLRFHDLRHEAISSYQQMKLTSFVEFFMNKRLWLRLKIALLKDSILAQMLMKFPGKLSRIFISI